MGIAIGGVKTEIRVKRGKRESAMTDESPGDAEFKRWFAQQDPFGKSEAERQIRLQEQIRQATVEHSTAQLRGY